MQVCLRDTIGAVVEMIAADASKKGLNIAYTIDEVLLRRAVLGDAIRIRQVKARDRFGDVLVSIISSHRSCMNDLAHR